jgi:hypothetical protein
VSVYLIILLGGKGVRVSTPFINAFQEKKAWNVPKSSTNFGNFKTCIFPPQNVALSKLFFSLLEMWRFSFLFGNFPEHSLHMYVFMGDFSTNFCHKK